MKIDPHQIIPKAYFGREQAYIKHLLLEGYLERLLYIVGYRADILGHSEIVFVDCFAGPWQDDSEDLASTSIAISLRLLSKIQKDLTDVGKIVRFRALYVEQDNKAFERLEKFLQSHSPSNVMTNAIHGDFIEKIPEILSRCSSTGFAFFFIDPKGWTPVKPDVLYPLLSRPRSEFLINFMYNFVNWAVSMGTQRNSMRAMFGQDIDLGAVPDDPGQRERYLVEQYRTAVVTKASLMDHTALSGYVTILDPVVDRTKYHLIYLTRHPKGIVEFMKQSEMLHGIQKTVRTAAKFNKKNETHRTLDLFGVDASQPELSKQDVAGDRIMKVEQLWLARFQQSNLTVTEEIFAKLLSESNCFPSELQQALRNLITRGLIVNLDADVARRPKNVVNFEKNERLKKL